MAFAGRLAGALMGFKTADGRHETLLAMLRIQPASLLMPVPVHASHLAEMPINLRRSLAPSKPAFGAWIMRPD